MIESPKLYYVAETKSSPRIAICRIEQVAALLNAGKIGNGYVAREWTGPHSKMGINDYAWRTISDLLEIAYRNKPIVSVIIKDLEADAIIVCERYYSEDGPWQVAIQAAEDYFAQHFSKFQLAPRRRFQAYFKSESCPPSTITFTLKVESHTVRKGIVASPYEPFEETFPYQLVDLTPPKAVRLPDLFPSISFSEKPIKCDPTAPLPLGYESRLEEK